MVRVILDVIGQNQDRFLVIVVDRTPPSQLNLDRYLVDRHAHLHDPQVLHIEAKRKFQKKR